MKSVSSKTIRDAQLRLGSPVKGDCVELDGDQYIKIGDSHLMPEFMMTLTSSSDHWMFISSNGAVTAGRQNADNALFPYYSADKIIDTQRETGSLTVVRVKNANGEQVIWRPFYEFPLLNKNRVRNLYKNSIGNKLCFEEIDQELNLVFRYRWTFSHHSGFIRTAWIKNIGNECCSIELIDGIQNILPYGVDQNFQLQFGNLVDAYKKSELTETGIGIHYLSSIPTDCAEPSEGLRATAVWHTRPANAVLISGIQLNSFLKGRSVQTESDVRGRRGAHLLNYQFDLNANEELGWEIVAETQLDQTDIADLAARIQGENIRAEIDDEITECENRLACLIAKADGFQSGRQSRRTQRHQSNVMFNIMRGGIPVNEFEVCVNDLRKHVAETNRIVSDSNREFLSTLSGTIQRDELVSQVFKHGDQHLTRIVTEYIPLVFSRRHGDPTRPWNKFSINSHVGDDERLFDYEGNWRDIFQNWEALAVSYPQYIESMICRFVNASTADGYNPYRLTKNGFEWESPEPDNPWSNIGYWGDHQINYLVKLLEISRDYFPNRLDDLLNQDCFVYANVPYRIKSAEAIFEDPRDTVSYDFELAKDIERRVAQIGNDGKLLADAAGSIRTATLAEKLLLPALIKMSNFVPGGGIWMNTQRPEWNDANNALVGYGLSVVTTCYLRRYFLFLVEWLEQSEQTQFEIADDILILMNRIQLAVSPYLLLDDVQVTNSQRHQIVSDLSNAGSSYRYRLYEYGLSEKRANVASIDCLVFFKQCLRLLDATIESNKRSDGLYHSYNLMSLDVPNEIQIERLYEMLEGQVAVLNSGLLSPEDAIDVLDALKRSTLFREDQQSYMLYPNRELPRFMEKNSIPSGLLNQSTLLQELLDRGDESIVKKDIFGNCHFNGDFRNAKDVETAVLALSGDDDFGVCLEGAASQLSSMFENIFCHHQFTGRSGTFFAYEGLGSIYWHMVSKLLLAVADVYTDARKSDADAAILEKLKHHYREIRAGIGAEKSPMQYGAFPMDPYSHTPEHAGAQQPGMTGQVKEDILSRLIEIGIRVEHGRISFEPSLLDRDEFSVEGNALAVCRPHSDYLQIVDSGPNSFQFTICGVPVIYLIAEKTELKVVQSNDDIVVSEDTALGLEDSQDIFARNGSIERIELSIDETKYF